MSKIFIYTDAEYDFDKNNVFLSTPYKDLSHFKKENPDLCPVLSYNVRDIIPQLEKLEEENARLREAIRAVLDNTDTTITTRVLLNRALKRGE